MDKALLKEYLAKGGKITVLPPQRAKKSLGFAAQGHKFSEYNIGKKKVDHQSYAAKRAA